MELQCITFQTKHTEISIGHGQDLDISGYMACFQLSFGKNGCDMIVQTKQ